MNLKDKKKDEKLFDKLQLDKSSYLSKLKEKKRTVKWNWIINHQYRCDFNWFEWQKGFCKWNKVRYVNWDTCPICGNEIHSLGEHIDFESIAQKIIK